MYYRQIKRRKMIKYLELLGFECRGGGSHDKFLMSEKPGSSVIVPRHNMISPGVVDSITKLLVEQYGISLDDIKNHLR